MVTLVVLLVLAQPVRTDVTEANADAKVVLVTPRQVHVTSVLKQGYEAVVGLQLLKTDKLVIPADATVALRLKNGHVVRLDDDLELQVADIALFNAPPKTEDVGKQLERMLTEQEKAAGPSRLMGWNAGQTAANVKSSADVADSAPRSKKKSQEVVAVAPSQPPAPASAPSPSPSPSPSPPPPAMARAEPASSESRSQPKAGGPASPAVPAAGDGPVAVAPGTAAGSIGAGVRGGGPGSQLTTLVVDPQLTACVNGVLTEQTPGFRRSLGGKLTLRLRKSTDRLRLNFTNHLPVPECVKTWATERREQVPSSIELVIPLK